jgi:hypothetical protein
VFFENNNVVLQMTEADSLIRKFANDAQKLAIELRVAARTTFCRRIRRHTRATNN